MPDVTRNGRPLWNAILEAVGTHWEPFIAGGCLRDSFLGLEPKDIDVIVPAADDADFMSIIDGLDPLLCNGELIYVNACDDSGLFTPFIQNNPGEYAHDAKDDLVAVWEGEIIGVPVNIIGRRKMADHSRHFVSRADDTVGGFDFRWLMMWYTEAYGLMSAHSAIQDCHNGIARLEHGRTYAQSIARFQRFKARHPNKSFGFIDNVETLCTSSQF